MPNPIRKKLSAHAAKGYSQLSAAEADLYEIYSRARNRIERELATFLQKKGASFTGPRLVGLFNDVSTCFSEFEQEYCQRYGEALSYMAKQNYAAALHDMGLEEDIVGSMDKKLFENMRDDSFTHIAGATRKMQTEVISNLRKMSARVMREATLTGMTRQEVSRKLAFENAYGMGSIFQQTGNKGSNFQFIDAGGKQWKTDAYFKMLGRTLLHNNARECYLAGCAGEGSDIVSISISGDPCDVCAKYENTLLSISGKTKGLVTLDQAMAEGLFHPNCTHRMVAVPEVVAKEYYTDDGKEKAEKDVSWEQHLDHQAKRKAQRDQAKKNREERKAAEEKKFVPAKTVKEAENFIKEYIADDIKLEIKKSDLSVVNEFNELLANRMQMFGIKKFDALRPVKRSTSVGGVLDNDFSFKPGAFKNKEKRFEIEVTRPMARNGVRWTVMTDKEDGIRALVDHEIGHLILDKYGNYSQVDQIFRKATTSHPILDATGKDYVKKNGIPIYKYDGMDISLYASSNDPHEFFAESFSMYMSTERDKMPGYIREMIEKMIAPVLKKKSIPTINNELSAIKNISSNKLEKDLIGADLIKGKHSIKDDLKATNPNYNKSEEWNVNCQRVVYAYEARRRGYDVVALPRILEGQDPMGDHWKEVCHNMKWNSPNNPTAQGTLDAINKAMTEFGNDSRAVVFIEWERDNPDDKNKAHVFIAENVEGKIKYVDPQNDDDNVDAYFWGAIPEKTCFARLDNLKFSDYIKLCCERRKP